jgi:hypothetical protein
MFEIRGSDLYYIGDEPTSLQEALDISIKKWEILAVEEYEGRPIWDAEITCGLCTLIAAKAARFISIPVRETV